MTRSKAFEKLTRTVSTWKFQLIIDVKLWVISNNWVIDKSLLKPCCIGYNTLFSFRYVMIALLIMCSITLQEQLVRDIGLYVSTCSLFPSLWIGITLAHSQSLGREVVLIDVENMICKKGGICWAYLLKNIFDILSGPDDFLVFICKACLKYLALLSRGHPSGYQLLARPPVQLLSVWRRIENSR